MKSTEKPPSAPNATAHWDFLTDLDPRARELIEEIRDAFADVRLEDGVGMTEADYIDEYFPSDSPERREARAEDTDGDDWTELLSLFLAGPDAWPARWHSSGYCFMDDTGKRFILPCFLIEDLVRGQVENPVYMSLLPNDDGVIGDHGLLTTLTTAQLDVLDRFLRHRIGQECDVHDEAWANDIGAWPMNQALVTLRGWRTDHETGGVGTSAAEDA